VGRTSWIVVIVASAKMAFADPSHDDLQHYKDAEVHYRAGDYEQAIAELRLAFAASPEPQYLFAMGQAYRASGDCARAIESYGAYLRTGPKPNATRETQLLVDECQGKLASTRVAAPEPAPAVAPGPPRDPLVIREVQWMRTRETIVPWYRDWLGDTAVGAGTASLVAGSIALVLASHRDDAASRATTYNVLQTELRARDRDQLIGGVSIGAGCALIAGGLIHYALRPKRVRTEVVVDPAAGGGVTVGARVQLP
jgi:tetratricopeptide (TPR) repeat protein